MDSPFADKVLLKINELITIKKNLQSAFYSKGDSKNANLLNFKLRSYHKWINNIKSFEDELNLVSSITDIKQFQFTPKLESKVIEIFNNNSLQDIEDTQKEIENLTLGNVDASASASASASKSSKKSNAKLIIKVGNNNKRKTDKGANNISGNSSNKQKSDTQIAKVERPLPKKNKTQQKRPIDEIGQKIYDLQKVTGFGPKTADKMVKENKIYLELLLKEWEHFCAADPNNHIINPERMNTSLANPNMSVCSISGLNRMRNKIIEDKFKNTKYLKYLNHHQLVGIKYYHDINLRIPRSEIEKIEKVIKHICNAIDKDFIVEICGSYRRGRSNSGDVDTLIAHSKLLTPEQIKSAKPLSKIVRTLSLCNFLVDHLTNDGDTKYMGLGQLKGFQHSRRVDIRFVPYYCFAPALLYFTGSMTFNTRMRNHALSKGYSLSEYGLRKMEFDKKQNKEVKGPIEIVNTEEDVFKFIDYPYSTPEERDI